MSKVESQIQGLKPSLALLVVMNLIPIAGVIMFGWDVGTLLLLYWVESVVIGLLNIPKILMARGEEGNSLRRRSLGGRLYLALFFTAHFGAFCFGHYTFLNSFFETIPPLSELLSQLLSMQGLMISAAGLFVSHFLSMLINFLGKGEYLKRSAGTQMFLPYGRIFIMHIVIIFGGIFVEAFGEPMLALLLLVILKIGIDFVSHAAEHGGLQLKSSETG